MREKQKAVEPMENGGADGNFEDKMVATIVGVTDDYENIKELTFLIKW